MTDHMIRTGGVLARASYGGIRGEALLKSFGVNFNHLAITAVIDEISGCVAQKRVFFPGGDKAYSVSVEYEIPDAWMYVGIPKLTRI